MGRWAAQRAHERLNGPDSTAQLAAFRAWLANAQEHGAVDYDGDPATADPNAMPPFFLEMWGHRGTPSRAPDGEAVPKRANTAP